MRVKDWLKTAAIHGLSAIGGSIMYSVMMYMMRVEESLADTLEIAVVYLLTFGSFMSVVLMLSVQKQNLPLALSFGATRKEAFCGMQCYRLTYLVLVLAAAAAMLLLTDQEGREAAWIYLVVGGSLILIFGSAGAAMGIVGIKYGKGAMAAMGVLMGVLTVGTIIGLVFAIMAVIETDSAFLGMGALALPLVAVAAYIGSMAAEYRMIRTYNVML